MCVFPNSKISIMTSFFGGGPWGWTLFYPGGSRRGDDAAGRSLRTSPCRRSTWRGLSPRPARTWACSGPAPCRPSSSLQASRRTPSQIKENVWRICKFFQIGLKVISIVRLIFNTFKKVMYKISFKIKYDSLKNYIKNILCIHEDFHVSRRTVVSLYKVNIILIIVSINIYKLFT